MKNHYFLFCFLGNIDTELKAKTNWTKNQFFNIKHLRFKRLPLRTSLSSLPFHFKYIFEQHSKNKFLKDWNRKKRKKRGNPSSGIPDSFLFNSSHIILISDLCDNLLLIQQYLRVLFEGWLYSSCLYVRIKPNYNQRNIKRSQKCHYYWYSGLHFRIGKFQSAILKFWEGIYNWSK